MSSNRRENNGSLARKSNYEETVSLTDTTQPRYQTRQEVFMIQKKSSSGKQYYEQVKISDSKWDGSTWKYQVLKGNYIQRTWVRQEDLKVLDANQEPNTEPQVLKESSDKEAEELKEGPRLLKQAGEEDNDDEGDDGGITVYGGRARGNLVQDVPFYEENSDSASGGVKL